MLVFCYHYYYYCFDEVARFQVFLSSTDGGGDALWAGLQKQKRKQSAGLAASTLAGGIATNKVTTFWWKWKRQLNKLLSHP